MHDDSLGRVLTDTVLGGSVHWWQDPVEPERGVKSLKPRNDDSGLQQVGRKLHAGVGSQRLPSESVP
jgi:hypothetical protein